MLEILIVAIIAAGAVFAFIEDGRVSPNGIDW